MMASYAETCVVTTKRKCENININGKKQKAKPVLEEHVATVFKNEE
jgi:hypothetical protein